MSQPATPEAVSGEARELADRLAVVIDTMRSNAQFDLDCFLRSFERGGGGKLVMEISSNRAKSGNVEAHYCSEGLSLQAG